MRCSRALKLTASMLSLLLSISLGLSACENNSERISDASPALQGPPIATIPTDLGEVALMAIDFDPRTQEVVIPCRFVEGSKLEYRSLHFQKSESKAGWYGSKVWIEDQDELKFGVSVELDPNVVGHVITREYTDRDVLSIESTYPENSDHCTEQYTQNGRILTCNFDPNAIDQDTIDAFDAFYDRSTSLENNADGNWMMGLLASSDFQSWFEDEAARGGKRDRDGEGSSCPWWLSWGSAGCTFLKCSFGGGILNPLCHACTGTSWACWIAEAVCHWGNC